MLLGHSPAPISRRHRASSRVCRPARPPHGVLPNHIASQATWGMALAGQAYAPPAPRNLFGGAALTAWLSGLEEPSVTPFRRTAAIAIAMLSLSLIFVACAGVAASPSATVGSSPSAHSLDADASPTTATDLTAIGCATDDPEDVGELTGAWDADDGGVYYIRQVGDCVWWFGTDLVDIESRSDRPTRILECRCRAYERQRDRDGMG